MMGIVDGDAVKESLLLAIKSGVFEDEAGISLLRTGDIRAMPVLVDYMSRRRMKGKRYSEIVDVIRSLKDPRIPEMLIGLLGSPDGSIRFVALKLMNSIAPAVLSPPRGTYPDDADLKQTWKDWWATAKESYVEYSVEMPQITKLTIITGFDLLPRSGELSRDHFLKMTTSMEKCSWKLRSLDLTIHREGELDLYGICRQLISDYDSGDADTRNVVVQYMDAFAGEVEEVCLFQKFPESKERTEFLAWVAEAMRSEQTPKLIFLTRIVGVVGEPDSVDLIRGFRDSLIEGLRNAAVLSMGKLGSPRAVATLFASLKDKDVFPLQARQYIVALERIGNKAAIARLVQTMRTAAPVVAYESYLALRRLRGKWNAALSLEEFEQARKPLCENYAEWMAKGASTGGRAR